MVKDDSYGRQVGHRLRAAAAELGLPTAQSLANAVGAQRSAVDAWFNGRALPPVPYLELFIQAGITLDWLFYGIMSQLSYQKAINLQMRMQGHPPSYNPPEMEAPPGPPDGPASVPAAASRKTPQPEAPLPASKKSMKRALAV